MFQIRQSITALERANFQHMEFALLSDVWSADIQALLENEAKSAVNGTHHVLDNWDNNNALRRRQTPKSQSTSDSAPTLARIHNELTPLLRALTGSFLVPAFAWYNFYESDDGIWLHVDPPETEISVLTTVLGSVGPLHLHPTLRGRTQEQLDDIYQSYEWKPDSGIPVRYPLNGVLVNRGHIIPHHRDGSAINERSVVAALHYSVL